MEGLSAKLQEIIESRPLKTLVDTEDTKSNTEWRDSIFVHYVSNDIPRVFDGRIVWKNYLSKIGNQGKCGSCWAWARVGGVGSWWSGAWPVTWEVSSNR